MLSHAAKGMRRSSRANCQTKPLQKRFVAAQERSEAFALSQRIGKAVCRGLIRIENTFTKTSPARLSFGTHVPIEELLGVTKRSVQPEKDSGNGNETATANSLPSKTVDFESSASANSATPAFDPELVVSISFRAEFAIADAGANFHLWPDCRDCADNFSALIHG